ncbi:hypothetical protein C4D60_Mb02t05640 [Musa balbisiana]|uniref:Uncharacterized protein n=1 Tax=Musa balbisiana TaxID=52838 RepID=A0A4S8I8Q3_MUSBA|nr:hypothetical protein C4D60_Mb02t05640 [Musa balbisiana]
MDAFLIPQGSHGTMVEEEEEEEEEELRSVSSSSESFSSNSNASSSSSDSMDDATSSASPSSPATGKDQHDREPLNEMSSLLAHLPLKLPRVHCLVLVEGGTTLSVAGLLSLHTDQATSPANPFCLPNRLGPLPRNAHLIGEGTTVTRVKDLKSLPS